MPSDNGLPGGLPAELWDYIGRMLPARAVVNLSMTNKAMASVQKDTIAHHRGNFLFLGTLRDNRQHLLDQWRDQSLIREHNETWVTQQLDSMLTLLEIAAQSPLYPSTHDAAPPPGSVVGNGAEWTNFV